MKRVVRLWRMNMLISYPLMAFTLISGDVRASIVCYAGALVCCALTDFIHLLTWDNDPLPWTPLEMTVAVIFAVLCSLFWPVSLIWGYRSAKAAVAQEEKLHAL